MANEAPFKRGDCAPFMCLAKDFGLDVGDVYVIAWLFHARARGQNVDVPRHSYFLRPADARVLRSLGPNRYSEFYERVVDLTAAFQRQQRGVAE